MSWNLFNHNFNVVLGGVPPDPNECIYSCSAFLDEGGSNPAIKHLWPMNPAEGLLDSDKGGITLANDGLGRTGTIVGGDQATFGYQPCTGGGGLATGWREDNVGWGNNALMPAGLKFDDSASMACLTRGVGDEGVSVTFGGPELALAPWGNPAVKGASGNVIDGFVAFTTGSVANGFTGVGVGHYIPNTGGNGPLWQPEFVFEYFNLVTPVAGNQEIFFFAAGFSKGAGWVQVNNERFSTSWTTPDITMYTVHDQSSFLVDHYHSAFKGNTVWNLAFSGGESWDGTVTDDLFVSFEDNHLDCRA